MIWNKFKKLKTRGERNRTNWKIVLVISLILGGVMILGFGNIVFAQNYDYPGQDLGLLAPGELWQTSGETAKQGGVFLNIAVEIAAFCVTLLGALINFSLRIGNNVINLPIVQIGSQIVLNFANLGFVLAIIIIAFATIFRVQSYAMKQTLWKLIVAALLVNFSLVIAGAFISVSNTFTNYFLDKIQGGDLAKGLMGILNPQSLAQIQIQDPSIWSILGDLFSYFLKYIASLFFVLAFTFLVLLTFFALFIMLLIRAIYLAILLILMPIVWLLWIFPGTSKHWQKWWSEFIRWNFFAPAMLFFIFLVIQTGKKMEDIRAAANINNAEIAAAFGKFLTLQPDFIQYVTQLVITTGLLMGGLIAANSLSITFASTAYGWAQGAGKWFGGAVKGAGKLAGRKTYEGTIGRVLGGEKVKSWTEKLSGSKFVGARLLGQGFNRLGVKSEKYLQADYEKLAKELSPDRLNKEILSSRGTKRAVLLKEAAKRKDIDLEKLTSILNNPEELEKIEKDFAKAGLNIGDVWKAIGRNSKMVKAAAANDDNALRLATNEFVKGLTPKDYAKGQWNDIFKDKSEIGEKIQKQLAGAFAMFEPGAYAKIAPHLKGETLDKFAGIMRKELDLMEKMRKDGQLEPHLKSLGYEEVRDIVTRIEKAEEALTKTLSRRFIYGEREWEPKEET